MKKAIIVRYIYTIGYEKRSLESFILILHQHHIQHLIDVRRNPISRKAGFSKHIFASALLEANIQYTHIVDLGTPKDIRNNLKTSWDYDTFFEQFTDYIVSQTDALQQAVNIALQQNTVLLCFERNPRICHRSVVAAEMVRISNLQLSVEHILL